jgi:hypothetical protein
MRITAKDIRQCVPNALVGTIVNITPMGSYFIATVECDTHGHEYTIPIRKEYLSQMLQVKGVVAVEPGEEVPKHTKPVSRDASSRSGPKIGSRRKIKGVLKECIRYDFESVDIPGKRRQRDPSSGKLGYPVWAAV